LMTWVTEQAFLLKWLCWIRHFLYLPLFLRYQKNFEPRKSTQRCERGVGGLGVSKIWATLGVCLGGVPNRYRLRMCVARGGAFPNAP
jgi:hypothetical protein